MPPAVDTLVLAISTSVKASATIPVELVPAVLAVPLVIWTKPSAEMPVMPGLLGPRVVTVALVIITPGPTPITAAAPSGAKPSCEGPPAALGREDAEELSPSVVTRVEFTMTWPEP